MNTKTILKLKRTTDDGWRIELEQQPLTLAWWRGEHVKGIDLGEFVLRANSRKLRVELLNK